MTKVFEAINWNALKDDYVLAFWDQQQQQYWLDKEIPVSSDKMTWIEMEPHEREVYKRVLGGLTLLDTEQSLVGMPKIAEKVTNQHKRAVLTLFANMEAIHAKSYSTIFTTLATNEEIDEIFSWVRENKYLQKKANIIDKYYTSIVAERDLYIALVASVFLESFLFYSGFYYPLLLSGQGKMTASGEIISLIIRDESIHGVFVGLLAQEIFRNFKKAEQRKLQEEVIKLLEELYANELLYTDELYSTIGLNEDVKKYIRYNANKALMNIGYEQYFTEEEINPIVLNGIRTETKQHDFFSVKGNSYTKATNVEPLKDEDFDFNFQ
ncbi:class 1b ribonucleoside-diphosphate reductase subunit beta (plasmid) [Paenibacillus larvae subsp. pulvifaciens]|uniref:Ribonucleoside-diphosphate reductase subunit beta n=1 Tax=Paenibacillus larvae subsp. pulvifaciens TaxID=1477 RepID=A0A1V0UZZ8_9BACL|nr:class 1b ribonucleoside-diphosphate reductase subunit beta [Paenibacillus larvae]ARF70671.1 class 1b ribonucleoside-diphosphate reductase subunit beta [Paenibacillus larvae subsp. pulvifaciens]